jgi:H+/Na+-translocating ferredoxin:NAD+ oxidoreductase subunit B
MALAQIITTGAILFALGIACTVLMRLAAQKNKTIATTDLITLIDELLPQTQCGECGHMGCRPYATAIAQGEAINRCPPGGDKTITALANLLDKPIVALDGVTKPDSVAFIREGECIGCTKCIQACPVDAILGAAKLMHTVIADECTGCDLCVEPCPVDCIEMRPIERITQPTHYRDRFIAHNARLERDAQEREQKRGERAHKLAEKTAAENNATVTATPAKSKQDEIREAIARSKAKKAAPPDSAP